MGTLENEAIKYAEEDYLKGVASVERTPNYEIINAFPGFIKTKLKYAFIAGAYYRDALLAKGKKFDRQKETKTCDNCKHSDLPGGYEPCVYCRNKDDWEPKESPCPCEDGIDSKACAGCPQDEWRKQTFRPFKDCDELVEFWSKNYQTGFRPANTKPLIWVRLKCDGRERLIVAFGKGFGTDFVEIGNKAKAVTLQKLFDDYEFLNGTPCGMEVEK